MNILKRLFGKKEEKVQQYAEDQARRDAELMASLRQRDAGRLHVTDLGRAVRRRLGWRGPLLAERKVAPTFIPRYIRRHYDTVATRTGPMTRRQRRVIARCSALLAKRGLV